MLPQFLDKVIDMQDRTQFQKGQAALFTIILFLLISLVIMGSFGALAVNQLRDANELILGKKTFATLEAGIEDGTWRALKGWNYNAGVEGGVVTLTNLNGGNSRVTVDDSQAQSGFPKLYSLSGQGEVSKRFRKIGLSFAIPDQKLALSVKSAIQAGYLGFDLSGSAEIHGSTGYNQGDVFSNGNIFSNSGTPLIDGSVSVARGIGGVIQQQHNTSLFLGTTTIATVNKCGAASTSICFYELNQPSGTGKKDLVQSFMSNTTAPAGRVQIMLGRIGSSFPNGALTFEIRKNKRVRSSSQTTVCSTVNQYSDCIDMPDTGSGSLLGSKTISATALQGHVPNANQFAWVTIDTLPVSTASYISNEKYWFVIDSNCADSGGCSSTNYYAVAGSDGSYTYGQDVNALANTDFDASKGNTGRLFQVADYLNIPGTFTGQAVDMAFRIYMGSDKTEIRSNNINSVSSGSAPRCNSTTAGDELEIIGSAKAQYMTAVDIGGFAFYESLAPYVSLGEVKAGGDYYDATNKHLSPPTPYAVAYSIQDPGKDRWHNLTTNQYQCHDATLYGNTDGRGPLVSSATAFKKTWNGLCDQPRYASDARWHGWDYYCSCNWNGSSDTTATNDTFCQVVSGASPEDKKIPDPVEIFGHATQDYQGEVMNYKLLNELKLKARSLGEYTPPTGTLTLASSAGIAATTTIPGITPAFGYDNPYFTSPAGKTAISGGYINGNLTLNTSAAVQVRGRLNDWQVNGRGSNPSVSASTTLQNFSSLYGFYDKDVNGNNVAINMAETCPYNVRHGKTNSDRHEPCYVLWVTGDLQLTGTFNEIAASLPLGISDQTQAKYSVYIIVEGTVYLSAEAKLHAFNVSDGKSQFFMISLSPNVNLSDPAAIRINGNAKGSTFLALRGAVAATQNVSVSVKAIVAPKIILGGNPGARVYFEDGLKNPYADSGGAQLSGANITAYYEY